MSPASLSLPDEKTPATARAADRSGRPPSDAAPQAPPQELPVTVIEGGRPFWPLVDFGELWRHREMLLSLTMREIMRRYKQSRLGVVWAVLPVVGNTALIGFVFGPLMKAESTEGLPPHLFIFSGMLPWYLFLNIVMGTAHSVINHPDLICKIYFPRLILPLSAIGDRLIDFVIGLGVLLAVQAFVGTHMPGSDLVLLPVVVVGFVIGGLGFGLLMGAAGVRYRDVFHALTLITQLWFFATPTIFYSTAIIPERYAWLKAWLPLNPAYGLIVNFRAAMLGTPADLPGLGISLGVCVLLFVVGLVYFQRAERHFADVI